MQTVARNMFARTFAMLFALTLVLVVAHGGARAQGQATASQQQLDQMLAPIALYPDALLAQVLMAATYPLEVAEAARWSRNHPNLAGDDAVRAAERENWDPSVKSLLAFPQVLARMDENLQWTQALGDAFLDQEPQVMDTVQNLRRRAQAAGTLRSDERQSVIENGPIVVVQPVNPQIVYVPYYDPMVVYGSWWWPEYRPVYWRPFHGYYAQPGFAASFFWGPSIRISNGFFFGAFDWPQRQVRVVHVNHYYNVPNRRMDAFGRERAPGSWQHDPDHRRGVAYRSPVVQHRFVGTGTRLDRGDRAREADVRRHDRQPDAGVRATQRSDWRSEPRIEASRSAVQAPAQAAAQPAVQAPVIQPAVQPRASAGARVDRRDQSNRVERGDWRDRPARSPEPRAAGVIPPQVREGRGESRREASRPAVQAPVQAAAQPAAQPAVQAIVQPAVQPRVASPRPEAARATESPTRTPRAHHEARNDATGQRGARAEEFPRQPRQQR